MKKAFWLLTALLMVVTIVSVAGAELKVIVEAESFVTSTVSGSWARTSIPVSWASRS